MTEEFWKNSQLSIARFYGTCQFRGHEYIIVNKDGKDIFECSIEAEKAGREKSIEPGEPADLCRQDFVEYYRQLGRDAFLQVLRDHPRKSDKELAKIYRKKIKELKKEDK